MPDGSAVRFFPTPPRPDDPELRSAIESGSPEVFAGLAWHRPNFEEDGHVLICTFEIPVSKRPGSKYIPCSICSNEHPKFLRGGYLWSPDRRLRLIGRECASKRENFGEEGFRRLIQAYNDSRRDDVALEWMQTNGSVARGLSLLLNALMQNALFIERQQKTAMAAAPQLFKYLAATTKETGTLAVEVRLSEVRREAANFSGRGNQDLFEREVVGQLSGFNFFRVPRRSRKTSIEECMRKISLIPAGSGDDIIDALIEQGSSKPHGAEGEITIIYDSILQAIREIQRIYDDIAEIRRFFSVLNMQTLKRWGEDSRNLQRFKLDVFPKAAVLVAEDRARFQISLSPPDLPSADIFDLTGLAAGDP